MEDKEKQTEEDNKEAQDSNDEEGLELDKLQTSSRPSKTPEAVTPTSEETEDEVKAPPKKAGSFLKSLTEIIKDKAFIISIVIGIVISAIVFLVPLKNIFLGTGSTNEEPVGKIVYSVSSYLGFRHNIKFRLSIGYTSMEERRTFMRKLPRLKDTLAIAGDLPEVKEAVKVKNLNFLERYILTLISDTIGAPLARLHIEQLRLD